MAFPTAPAEVSGIVGQGRSSFLDRMKEEFLPAWEDHVHKKVIASKLLAEKKGTMGGRRSLTSVMDGYPQSAGIALFEDAALPTPRAGSYFNPQIISRSIYSRLRWSGHVERAAAKGDKVAWSKPRTEDLRTARIQFELNFARMLYLGPQQVLGKASAVASPTSITLYGRDARTSQAADLNKYGNHYLRKNMTLAHAATVTSAQINPQSDTAAGWYVTALGGTLAAPTVTLNADPGTDIGVDEHIIPYNSRKSSGLASDDSDFAGINGLLNIAVDRNVRSTVYGITRASFPSLEAVMINNSSGGVRPFKEDYITLAVDRIGDDGTGDDPDVILCNKAVRREYVKEVSGDRRFPEILKTKGFASLKQQVGDIALPLMTDRDCMPGVMWVLESDGFGWFSEAELQMVDDAERFVADKDAHEIVMVKAGNCASRKPHNNAMVDDIQFSVAGLTDL